MTEEHECCWHDTYNMLMSYPPQRIEICCWCGKTRHIPATLSFMEFGVHGEHSPDKKFVIQEELK